MVFGQYAHVDPHLLEMAAEFLRAGTVKHTVLCLQFWAVLPADSMSGPDDQFYIGWGGWGVCYNRPLE